MQKRYIPLKWLTPEQFNSKIRTLKLLHKKYEVFILPNRVNLLEENYWPYSVDLVTGEAFDLIDMGNIGKALGKICPTIESGYGRKELIMPEFGRPDKTIVVWDYSDPGNYSYVNERYRLKKLKCWSYDINSAYAFAMLKPMPDTSKPLGPGIVRSNEMGFRRNNKLCPVVSEGNFANERFPLIESPYIDYVKKIYAKKLKAEKEGDKKARQKWKDWLNLPSGMLHRKNIFHRLALLHYAKEYIRQFIDENTVYCNVDSIVSLKPRPDIPISDKIGEFKLEHSGEPFKFKNTGIYQWNNECHYQGIPTAMLDDIEDINNLKQINKYYYREGYIWPE